MIFYRFVYDTFAVGETKTFTFFSPCPTPQSKLFFFHLYNKDAVLTIKYKSDIYVNLDTTKPYDFPPGLPLNLIVLQYYPLLISIKNTKDSPQDIFLAFAFDTQVAPLPEFNIKVSTYAYTDPLDSLSVMRGVPDRKLWLDCIFMLSVPPDPFKLFLDGNLIIDVWNVPQTIANHHFHFLVERPLMPSSELVFEPDRAIPSIDTRLILLYLDMNKDAEVTLESAPFPFFPVIPPYPYIPYIPTPVDPTPPLPDIDPIPDIDPQPDIPPYVPSDLEPFPYVEYEYLDPIKTAIPISLVQKNKISNQPLPISQLRPSFFPSSSTGRREKVSADYTKTFSHLLGEALFNTVPLRASETGQFITTNVKDDYRVLSLTHDHANYTDYFYMMPFTHLTLKTGAAAWKLKVLTVYNWLSQVDISEMDEIDLVADKESYFPFYAIGFSLQCPTASGGSPQTITGMVEF